VGVAPGRTAVADVLVDGLTRAGAARVFVAPATPGLLGAAAARRLPVVEAPDAAVAAVLAAVSGEIGEGPGAVLAGLADARGLVRGLAHAQRDRAPLIVLTEAGADAVLLGPVVKASMAVERASAGHWIAHAANLALTDPRGPVHLVVDTGVAGEPALPVAASCRPAPLPPPTPASLDALGEAMAAAARPLIVAGVQCGPDEARWIRSFAEALPAPVLATPKGKGSLADPHPLALGALAVGHPALVRADLVILLGVDAGELAPGVLPGPVAVVAIGRAPWPGGENVVEVVGDLALVIEELAPRVRARPAADWDVAELDRIKRVVTAATVASPAAKLVALAREATPAGTLATGDVPALAAWQAVAPRETLSPLGMAIPGYAVVAAFAAQLAHPDRRVVAFTRASGLSAGEAALARAAALGLPIVVVVLDGIGAVSETVAGLSPLAAGGEHAFAWQFSAAFAAGQPAVVVGQPAPS
jgi:acetolactate synthase-1/2/3 large subunit